MFEQAKRLQHEAAEYQASIQQLTDDANARGAKTTYAAVRHAVQYHTTRNPVSWRDVHSIFTMYAIRHDFTWLNVPILDYKYCVRQLSVMGIIASWHRTPNHH